MSNNILMSVSEPIFEFVLNFKRNEQLMQVKYEVILENTLKKIQQFEQKGFDHQVPISKLNKVKYALVALVDEVVISSSWDERLKWARNTLQMQCFGENSAGDGFFNYLNEIRKNIPSEADVLEVYYYCMQLGFKGKYNSKNDSELNILFHDIKLQIQSFSARKPMSLISGVVVDKSLKKKVERNFGLFEWSGLFFLSCFLIYNLFFYLNHMNFDILDKVLKSILGE